MFPGADHALRAATVASLTAASAPAAPPAQRPKIALGLLTYCFAIAQRVGAEMPGLPKYNEPLVFIEEAARMGADAVQFPFGAQESGALRTVRETAEKLGIALEGTTSMLLENSDLSRFEAEMRTLRELGASVARIVVFPGRRYEDYPSYAAYQQAERRARAFLRQAEPIARRERVVLAVENHKDQRMNERVKLLEEFSSEWIGACIDVGNNLALLEDPLEVSRALLPWARSVHFKDQGVQEYEDGFLLADVPLGRGCIDLPGVIRTIREKVPKVHFQLELITRDPLKVPVLRESYWRSLPHVKAPDLAATLAMVKGRSEPKSFPLVSPLSAAERVTMERRNLEESFRFASEHLNLAL